MAGPLAGLKVLDLSRILAGPWSTQVLADFGAEVWKIERPNLGDDTRHWGPPFLSDSQESAYYLAANRGKKSFEIDIQSDEGQARIRQLALQADILVENYKVGALKKYQLDYSAIKAINPKIIYCSITGFGQTGPYAHQAGYDAMIQAMGGLMSITGEPEGMPGGQPQKVGVAIVDLMTGMYAVSGILAALHHRNNTGEGQHIDIALFDTQVATLANQASNYLVSGNIPKRLGSAHPSIVPYQSFAVSDGYIFLAVGNDRQFAKCCAILGCEELASNDLYQTNQARVNNRTLLIEIIAQRLKQQSAAYWLQHFTEQKVPCGPINDIEQVFADPQIKHRAMQFELTHPTEGSVTQVANPIKFSQTPIDYQQAPPTLGEHNKDLEQLVALSQRQPKN